MSLTGKGGKRPRRCGGRSQGEAGARCPGPAGKGPPPAGLWGTAGRAPEASRAACRGSAARSRTQRRRGSGRLSAPGKAQQGQPAVRLKVALLGGWGGRGLAAPPDSARRPAGLLLAVGPSCEESSSGGAAALVLFSRRFWFVLFLKKGESITNKS